MYSSIHFHCYKRSTKCIQGEKNILEKAKPAE